MKVTFTGDTIEFENYPWPTSRVYPEGRLRESQLMEVYVDATPPRVLTGAGEFVPIPADMKQQLRAFAIRNALPMEKRLEVWGLICQPFIRHDLTRDDHRATMETLSTTCSLSSDDVLELRDTIGEALFSLNHIFQEREQISLFDVLDAMVLSLTPQRFDKFFRRAMRVARSG